MPPEKLPVPTEEQITLLASDFGSVFQTRMNAVAVALRNAIIAFNAQIDAGETASQQVEPSPLDVALDGLNNSYKVTPLSLHHVIKKFGLGAAGSRFDVQPDDAVTNGFFSAPAAWPNSPYEGIDASNQGTILTMKHADPSYGTHFFGSLSTSDDFKLRRISANIVQPWVTLFHTKNVVGTVSQSGGTPTGALFQRGSNVHGHFTIFADGTADVWQKSSTAYAPATTDSGLSYSTVISWEFPITFAAPPTTYYSPAELVGISGVQTWAIGAGKLGPSSPTTVNDYPIYMFFSRAGDYSYKLNCFAKGRIF